MSDTHPEVTSSRSSAPPSLGDGPSQVTSIAVKEETQAVQLVTEYGKTVIADTVVAKIAGAAAREVEGVHDLVAVGAGATIAGFAGRLSRTDIRVTGVNVEVGQREAAIDLNVTIDYGVNIPRLAEAVRQNIMDRVRGMTGLVVKEVNINAADLYFPEEEAARQRVH